MKNLIRAKIRQQLDERRADKAEAQHRSTSAQRHEQFLVDWSWARKPVFAGIGIVWATLTLLLLFRAALVAWQTFKLFSAGGTGVSSVTDIELVFVGIFGAWLGLTGTIFKILGPFLRRSPPRDRVSDSSKVAGELTSAQPESDASESENEDEAEQVDDEDETQEDEQVDLASFDPEMWQVLLAVCNEVREAEPNSLARKVQMSPVRVRYYLEQLEKIGFVEHIGYEEEFGHVDTAEGRAYIVEHNVDRDGVPF